MDKINKTSCGKSVAPGMNGRAETVRALIALGSNLSGQGEAPWSIMAAAVRAFDALPGVRVTALSGLWRSAAWGRVRQPVFHNAVMVVDTALSAQALLRNLLWLEALLGRRRGMRAWGPRVLDLDLLDHGGRVQRPAGMGNRGCARVRRTWQNRGLVLPHPGMHERPFVLLPLLEVAPEWRHPVAGAGVRALVARLPWRLRAQCRPVQGGKAGSAWSALKSRIG